MLRATDAAALIEGCVPGEPLRIEEPDPERLAEFWTTYYDIVSRRRRPRDEETKESSWTQDTQHGPSTCCR